MTAAGYYSDRSIERVRSATDIGAVIGRYVTLKKAGRSIKGLCPFHKEKTPSFFVSPERQMYHCFGCGAGGDVFSFLMNYLSFSFTEAVEELAAESGIDLERTGRDSSRTDVFREILAEAHSYYRARLRDPSGSTAREYLASRALSGDTMDSLGIGWSPEKGGLAAHLRKRGYSDSQLVESGLALRSTRGSGLYDRFRGRVLFPISDRRGRVISFGGRLISSGSGDAPKYLNGPDSPIYSKGDYLYGYREAVSASRDLDMIILVEGYFDHARFVEKGFECTVATCGTALTPAQARQMAGLASSIYICYDGDSSGQRASVRAAEVMLREGHLPRIMAVPDGMDPDDYLRERPGETVLEMAGTARDPIRFALGLVGGWSTVRSTQKKVRLVRRLSGIAACATEPVIRETLLRIISDETGYSMKTLEQELQGKEKKSRPTRGETGPEDHLSMWDTRILASLLLSPEGLSDPLLDYLKASDLRTPSAASILEEIKRQAGSGLERFQLAGLQEPERSVCARILSVHPDVTAPEDRERLMRAVEKSRLEGERRMLRERSRSAGPEEAMELLKSIVEIERKLKKLAGEGSFQEEEC